MSSRVSLNELLRRSNTKMTGVHERVRERMIEVITRAYAEGINVQVSSGLRSLAEQQALYNQGRTTPGRRVTNAKPGQSIHNYGLAVDFFLTSEDGQKAVWTLNAKWKRVAAIAKSLGFVWGGDWKTFADNPHLEFTGGLKLKDIQAGKRPVILPLVKAEQVKTVLKPIPVKPTTKTYIVKRGDTISTILGTNDRNEWNKVVKVNRLKDVNTIYVGQRLQIPIK